MPNLEPSIQNAEHISQATTGDNISAKKVANYVWNSDTSQWERQAAAAGGAGVAAYSDSGGTDRKGLVDADRHVQTDVLSSALPTGAATAAKQLPDNHQVTVSNQITQPTTPSDTQPVQDISLTTRIDEASATVTYIGSATPGSTEGSASWQIKKIDSSSGTSITYADGDALFNNVWTNRAALSYS